MTVRYVRVSFLRALVRRAHEHGGDDGGLADVHASDSLHDRFHGDLL